MSPKKKAKKPAKKIAPKAARRVKSSAKSKPAKRVAAAAAAAPDASKLTFNHAMVYSRDLERALGFYRDKLGLKLIDDFRHEGLLVYARLRMPGGDGTIALHLAGPGQNVTSDGVRLYFEVAELDDFCRKLQAKGFYITQMPRMMPWGWRHAYLNDPDGHEISVYWAGENRMKRTMMKVAKAVAAAPVAKGRR